MKSKNNKKILYITLIAAGLLMITAAILLNIFKGDEVKSLAGVLLGTGAALSALSGGALLEIRIRKKYPEIQRKKEIEVNDERNTAIRGKAAEKSNSVFIWILFAVIMIFILLNADLYITATLAGLIVVKRILSAVYFNYYNKRL